AWSLGVEVHWLGKHSLFAGWRGPIMRGLGGIPVDRSDPGRIVTEVVARVRAGEVFGLVVTPDGTRSGHTHWKSGFHRIAVQTGMPVTLGYVDSLTRTTGRGTTREMTGDLTEDMDRIREFYAEKRGIRPQMQITPRLREEDAACDEDPETGDRNGDPEPNCDGCARPCRTRHPRRTGHSRRRTHRAVLPVLGTGRSACQHLGFASAAEFGSGERVFSHCR